MLDDSLVEKMAKWNSDERKIESLPKEGMWRWRRACHWKEVTSRNRVVQQGIKKQRETHVQVSKNKF